MKKTSREILTFNLILTSLAVLLGYAGSLHWIFDLFSHFKMQYFVILFLGSLGLLLMKEKIGLLFIPFIILTLVDLLPLYLGGMKDVNVDSSIKIVCINLLTSNDQYESVQSFIEEESPDILILQELNSIWNEKLISTLDKYSYKSVSPREDNFGIGLFSRLKLVDIETLNLGISNIPSITTEFMIGEKNMTLLATHPLPPIGKYNFQSRNSQFLEISKMVRSTDSEFILIGDLNCSSFSNNFKKLVDSSNLIDSRKGFGLLATWPTWFKLSSTTLDHCLVSQGIVVKSRKVGPDIGSDHLPIIIELGSK